MSVSMKFNASPLVGDDSAPWKNHWLVDCGFTLQPGAGFRHDVHSVHLIQVRYVPADLKLYFEFRLDTDEGACYRFVFGHPMDWAISGPGDEPRNLTTHAAASVGCCFSPALRSEAYVIPTDVNVGDTPYGGSWSPAGLTAADTIGWGFITVGSVRDYFLTIDELLADHPEYFDNANQFALFPQRPFIVEPACVQTLLNCRVQTISIANVRPLVVPDPCSASEVVPSTGLGSSNGQVFSGAVKLEAGFNCDLVIDRPGNAIEVNGKPGAGAGESCASRGPYESDEPGYGYDDPGLDRTCRNTVFTIDGVAPDGQGNLSILGGQGVTITSDPDAHQLTLLAAPESRFGCNG